MSTDGNEAPLINEQTAVNMGSQGRSSKQILKVAGVTLLAGILIAGQAFTAYMAYNQKEQLNTLERRSDRLQEISSRSVMRTPMKMHLPMASLALKYEDEPEEKKDSTTSDPKPELTQCQKEATGEVKTLLPSFRPKCDANGDYQAQQCWEETEWCWCVDKNGNQIPDSLTNSSSPQCSGFNSADKLVTELLGADGQ
ncbi:hypothetical protein QQF64_017424 [Cirrhinus molitorella]|uniref:Uncharacterized protein n=2 Tax=Cirrhinus molitorella TaxID=172907 RepID=A0ABR3LL31_9TELE|nr:hypothetical protein Q8A67_022803 [Cirrhinus molitorella]